MKEINIKIKNISQRQWPLLLVELNLVAQNWKRYGPVMNIKAKNFVEGSDDSRQGRLF